MTDRDRSQPPTDKADLAARLRALGPQFEELAAEVETAGSLVAAVKLVEQAGAGAVADKVLHESIEGGTYDSTRPDIGGKLKEFGGAAVAGAVHTAVAPVAAPIGAVAGVLAEGVAQTAPLVFDGFGGGTTEAVTEAERTGRTEEQEFGRLRPEMTEVDLTGATVYLADPETGEVDSVPQSATGMSVADISDGSTVVMPTGQTLGIEALRPGGGLVDPTTGEISDDQVAQALGLAVGEAPDPYATERPFAGSPAFETTTDPETGAVTQRFQPPLPAGMQMLVDSDFKFTSKVGTFLNSYILAPDDLYYAGDGTRIFNSMSLERRREAQKKLVDAGLIDEDDMLTSDWGRYTDVTSSAFEFLLAQSNDTSRKWWATLDGMKGRRAEIDAKVAKEERENLLKGLSKVPKMVYEAPDYAELTEGVKGLFAEKLGRDPQAWEMTLMADKLAGFDRAQFDTQVAAVEKQHRAGNRALLNDEDPMAGSADAGTVQGVSPEARLQKLMDERYGPELERLQGIGETASNQDLQRRASDVITRMVGG